MNIQPEWKKINLPERQLFGIEVIFFVLAVLFLFAGFKAQAEEKESEVAVSCSIPSVPGLNAPTIDKEK